jgi:hypothetical protein
MLIAPSINMKYHQLTTLLVLTFYILSCTPKQIEPAGSVLVVQDINEDAQTRRFINFWKEFSIEFDSLDTANVKKVTLDTIWLWGERVSRTDFIKRYFIGYSNSGFSRIILDTNKTDYSGIGCVPSPPVKDAVKDLNQPKIIGETFNCREVTIRDTLGAAADALQFTFLETTTGYRLFGASLYTYSLSSRNPMVDTIPLYDNGR